MVLEEELLVAKKLMKENILGRSLGGVEQDILTVMRKQIN